MYNIYNNEQIETFMTVVGQAGPSLDVFLQWLLFKLSLLFKGEHVLTKADFVIPLFPWRDLCRALQITERL